MKNWSITDIHAIEKCPTAPAKLQAKFSDILYYSTNCRCKVESINPTTGEYRVILTGTLDCNNDEGFGGNNPTYN